MACSPSTGAGRGTGATRWCGTRRRPACARCPSAGWNSKGAPAWPRRPYQAPFTDEDCLYADWHVEEYRHDPNDNDRDWVTIASGTLATPFFLEDDTGRVLVEADEDADFDLSDARQTTIRVGGSETPPPAIADFIGDDREDWDLADFLDDPGGAIAEALDGDGSIGHSSNRRRYVQRILPVDESVYVFGGADPVVERCSGNLLGNR